MGRTHATAFLLATIAALVVDAAMRLAMDAVRVSGFGGPPWWVTANLAERGRWVVFAMLLWWLAPRLVDEDEARRASDTSTQEAWRQVASAVIAVPLLWIAATWAVSAVRFTLIGSWTSDGRVFLSPEYYRALLVDLTPWALAAAVLMAVRRHV